MENLTRYNCVPIETERTKPTKQLLSQMSENTKSFDRTDSDATSGIGLEMAPNSNCSVSSESDKCSGTFQVEWSELFFFFCVSKLLVLVN